MARPAHQLVTWSGVYGTVAGPTEVWQVGVRYPTGTFQENNLPAAATMCQAAWGSNMVSGWGSDTILTRTRVASVGSDGHVVRNLSGGYVQADNTSIAAGTATVSVLYPLQTAICVTLASDRAGATGKGRIFLPWPAYTIAADYLLSAGSAQNVMNRVKNMLTAVKTIGSTGVQGGQAVPVVASSKGYLSPVTSVKVGRAPDTMRSRRGKLLEGYQSVAFP